uniref:Uncharacterized protein n=1 Tax=Poecilia reticulata TaxID=8081 RepID=A0A3P9NEN5_POERE
MRADYLCGLPPSRATSLKDKCGAASRSSCFCRTISAYLLPSGLTCCFKTKFSFGFKI